MPPAGFSRGRIRRRQGRKFPCRWSAAGRGLAAALFWAAGAGSGKADYLEETGWRELAAELGPALPDGSGVRVTQVEYGLPQYLPQAGSGSFTGSGTFLSGLTIHARGGASGESAHSLEVGAHFYGRNRNPQAGRAGFTPAIPEVDVYLIDPDGGSGSWLNEAWLVPEGRPAPRTEAGRVQNHSWISIGSRASAEADNEALLRLDFAVQRDRFLPVTGVNNGITPVPALMASAYNNLAVGLTTGSHSRGGTPLWTAGPGRQKPEIVAPLDYTSFATGLVSSGAALLYQTALTQGGNAARPETIKAVLLAGATKEEFPGWTRTAARPLDPVFGAGELHIGRSWRILSGQMQPANEAAARPAAAWAWVTAESGGTDQNFRLVIPAGYAGKSFSCAVVWNRGVRDAAAGRSFAPVAEELADYQLSLHRLPGEELIQESTSAVENLEHLWCTDLPSGEYRLRLSRAANSPAAPAALAWQMIPEPHRPSISLTASGGGKTLEFERLIPAQSYRIQSSADLSLWRDVHEFTAADRTFAWPLAPENGHRFYRLAVPGS